MNRRTVLRLGAIGIGGLSGCSADSQTDTQTVSETVTRTQTVTATNTQTAARTPRQNPNPIFVDPDGSDTNPGTRENPIRTIQEGFNQSQPGDTIHALPGEYREAVRTRRDGTAENPITLTGPPDALFRGDSGNDLPWSGFHFEHSHIHIRGLTFNGLSDPENPDRPESYVETIISAWHTPGSAAEYHRDLVIKPHGIGNTLRPLIYIGYSRQVEIGEFQVIGPAGLAMLEFGDTEAHNGEIVYLGHAPDKLDDSISAAQFGGKPDQSRDIHVHHIDNRAGHPHAELVDVKAGCSNVLIDYCTDAGGAGRYLLPGHESTSETSMHLGGRNVTLRWNVIERSNGQGVEVGSYGLTHPDAFEEQYGMAFPEELSDHGRANEIYGNRIVDCAGLAVQYPTVEAADGNEQIAEKYGPDEQTHVCGNVITGKTHGTPSTECPDELPDSDTIGHLGGDSPWA